MKTNQKILTGTIDVSKIQKERLYKGKKGTYLNITIFLNEENDKYNNNGFVIESLSKEERQSGIKGNIIGNVKYYGNKQEQPLFEEPISRTSKWDDEVPF